MAALEDIARLLTAAGAVQGLILAWLAWRRRSVKPPLHWFALLMLALAVLLALDYIEDRGVLSVAVSVALLWVLLVPGPAFWLYVRSMLGAPALTRRALALHFLPAIAMALPSIALAASLVGADDSGLAAVVASSAWSIWYLVLLSATAVSASSYVGFSLRWLRRHRAAVREVLADSEAHEPRWLAQLLAIAGVIVAAWLLGVVLESGIATTLSGMAQPVCMLIIGIKALEQPHIFGFAAIQREVASASPASETDAAATTDGARAAYARSGLTDERAGELRRSLDALMASEKPYLEEDLTLSMLAGRVGTSPQVLSQLLNQHLGRSFHDYIADFRIADVTRCLADTAYDDQTVLEVATAAGFRSKTAFNEAFKRVTGTTPTQFRRVRGQSR
jgi:AraC-like DNA-binding protein